MALWHSAEVDIPSPWCCLGVACHATQYGTWKSGFCLGLTSCGLMQTLPGCHCLQGTLAAFSPTHSGSAEPSDHENWPIGCQHVGDDHCFLRLPPVTLFRQRRPRNYLLHVLLTASPLRLPQTSQLSVLSLPDNGPPSLLRQPNME